MLFSLRSRVLKMPKYLLHHRSAARPKTSRHVDDCPFESGVVRVWGVIAGTADSVTVESGADLQLKSSSSLDAEVGCCSFGASSIDPR